MIISWLVTGWQRMQAAFNSLVQHRVSVSGDVTPPTIVFFAVGR